MNVELYNAALCVLRAVGILYKSYLQIVVHCYRYLSICSSCSSILLAEQHLSEEWRSNGRTIDANIFCAD